LVLASENQLFPVWAGPYDQTPQNAGIAPSVFITVFGIGAGHDAEAGPARYSRRGRRPSEEPTTVTLYDANGALTSIALGPAECIALASNLLNAPRRRFGRGPAGGSA
jgi:hypothetical protein